MNRPKIAIIDANTLATLGLKSILQTVMPIMTVDTFGSFTELEANHPEQYFHFFVSMHIVLENMSFFLDHRRKTIVLSTLNSQLPTLNSPLDPKGRFPQKELSTPNSQLSTLNSPLSTPNSPLSHFHSLCINVPESELVRSLLMLEQHAHGHGQNLPPMPKVLQQKILSDREIEVMSLIVQGFINKEIADKLNIGLSTVITHRKNIMDKLGLKSVSALTIYAVTHGYVDINTI